MTANARVPEHVRSEPPTGRDPLIGGKPSGGKSALLNHVLLQAITDKEK
jgi:tRNA U34 5-carboxymethylaminomethyl modifying GTPase MnmE/TrmE